MAKIKFEESHDSSLVILLISSMILILIGFLEPFEISNPKIYKYISAIGFLLQSIYFARMFLFRNYVQWNKKGIIIKINSWIGNSIRFDQIKSISFTNDKLELELLEGKGRKEINLSKIEASDKNRLKQIFNEHITQG